MRREQSLNKTNQFQPRIQSRIKSGLEKALTEYNPRLERFDLDYSEIAKLEKITIDEAREKFDYIELNPPEGDLVIQITINDDNVTLTIPYWYKNTNRRSEYSCCLVCAQYSDMKFSIVIRNAVKGIRIEFTIF
jgi:hypothetical protein